MENNKKNSFVIGSFYKLLNKDVKELNGIIVSLFSVLFLVGVGFISYTLTNNSYALFGDNITGSKTIEVEAFVVKSATETIIAKVGIDGIVEESHPATEQLEAVTDYRYTGANPNNYVSFNNELWRIIGVFPVDDGTGKIENRVKIIRNESIGNLGWNGNNINNWPSSNLQILLNIEDYYNRTGDYSSIGLTEEAKSMISDAKWYLGGSSSSNGVTTSMFYERERGTTVYSGRSTSFIGKIGLMYPSEYGYATSGGSTTNREECLATALNSWGSYSDCVNNDWLFLGSPEWTLTTISVNAIQVFLVYQNGYITAVHGSYAFPARPSLYLSYDVMISGGTGTSSDPYILQLPDTLTFNIDDSTYTADTGSTWQE